MAFCFLQLISGALTEYEIKDKSTTIDFEDSAVNANVFPAFTTDASVQTEKVIIMQHGNQISRSTQWKDLGKITKRKGWQTNFSKFQKLASTETSMECVLKCMFKLYFRGNSLSWNPKILLYCQKLSPISSLEYYWFFSNVFMSRGKYFRA